MISDLGIVFKVYLISLGLQLLVWPWVSRWFKGLADGGWALGRVLSLLAIGLPIWFLGHVWPVNTDWGVAMVILGLGLVGLRTIRFRSTPGETSVSRRPPPGRNYILVEEGLFMVGFFGLALVRGFQPDILGLEKFMDFGFIKEYLISSKLPVNDMWLAGERINYYSFGHFMASILVRVWGVGLGVGYNLMLAWILGTSLVLSFSVIVNLLRGSHHADSTPGETSAMLRPPAGEKSSLRVRSSTIVGGVMGALLTCLGGNSHVWWYLIKNKGFGGYWYANATRFITNTIHEFPGYSFVVSDLHAHVLGLPIVLTFVLILVAMLDSTPGEKSLTKIQSHPGRVHKHTRRGAIVLGVLMGVMAMTNTWDVAIYGLLLVVFGGLVLIKSHLGRARVERSHSSGKAVRGEILDLLRLGLIIGVVAGVVALPWLLNFDSFSEGVGLADGRSPWWQMGVLWGGHLTIAAIAMSLILSSRPKRKRSGEIPFNCKTTSQRDSSTALGMTRGWLGMTRGWLEMTTKKRRSGDEFEQELQNLFVLAMGVTAVLLILIPEVIYVKDIYTSHQRANTMFKLTYQAFILMSLLFGWVVGSLLMFRSTPGVRHRRNTTPGEKPLLLGSDPYRRLLLVAILVIWCGFMIFPLEAFNSYYGGLKTYKGLDGLVWLQKDEDKWGMIEYLEKHSNGRNMVEAVGDSYSNLNSISAFSGTPTVIGWRVHEWLWRGGYGVVGEREVLVMEFYEKGDKDFLKTFNVGWVVVGPYEREKYKIDESLLLSFGEVVWSGGKSYLIKVID